MNSPLRQLKFLPWLSLAQVGLISAFWLSVVELVLWFSSTNLGLIQRMFQLLYDPPMNLIMSVAIAAAVGALSVWLLEVIHPAIVINTGILWALILCVLVALFIKSWMPLPSILISPDRSMLIGVVLGAFWRGRLYWR